MNNQERISYDELGVNQMGEVYETLMSYTGTFASEDLYEVARKNDKTGLLDPVNFVNAEDLKEFKQVNRVYEYPEKKILRKHPKGKFIYRLAGKERRSSGSFYTPESLSEVTVKYALKESVLAKDIKTAKDILDFKFLEPTMGAAAFLNETINQLAELYLTRRQKELETTIDPKDYSAELQKVKRYIASRNAFGVDLNQNAIELGKLSMRLNCMCEDGPTPWFGFQVYCGNTLVGSRRQFYKTSELTQKNWFKKNLFKSKSWLSHDLNLGPDKAYHFLLPHPDMLGHAANKFLKVNLDPSIVQLFAQRRSEYKNVLSEDEIDKLTRISKVLDVLFVRHTVLLAQCREATQDDMEVWGADFEIKQQTEHSEKERYRELLNPSSMDHHITDYQLLKLVMDYWCALWFWPAEHELAPPSREEYIEDILTAVTFQFDDLFFSGLKKDLAQKLRDQKNDRGYVSLKELLIEIPRLKLAHELGKKYRHFHVELEFSDLFLEL